MAASDMLLVDAAQDACTSLSNVLWHLDSPGSGASDGPAARELSQRYTSNLALLDYKSPGTDGVALDGRLQQVQPGTAGVWVAGFAAEATMQAATQANIRQVLPMPVDLGRPSRRWPGAVTVRHKTGKEAQPWRRWSSSTSRGRPRWCLKAARSCPSRATLLERGDNGPDFPLPGVKPQRLALQQQREGTSRASTGGRRRGPGRATWRHRFSGTMKGKARPITSSARRPAARSRNTRASARSEPALAGDCP